MLCLKIILRWKYSRIQIKKFKILLNHLEYQSEMDRKNISFIQFALEFNMLEMKKRISVKMNIN